MLGYEKARALKYRQLPLTIRGRVIIRMKSPVLCATLILVLAAVLHLTSGEQCPSDHCMSREKCGDVAQVGSCSEEGDVCCSWVLSEFRTKCRQFGGECMKARCNDRLVVDGAQDCAADETCCILI